MSLKVPSLQRLIAELSKLPGVGSKSAQRMAMSFLKFSQADMDSLRQALKDIKEKIKLCRECYAYTEDEVCYFCSEDSRSKHYICVVENPSDIDRIESSGVFKGRYHVLHGAIAPLDNVGPENLKINELFHRIEDLKSSGVTDLEVILALDADLEGDTTALYLSRELARKNVQVSKIAQGVPMGGDLDFVDQRTLGRALENRIKYNREL
jgi:recombination protein RecR